MSPGKEQNSVTNIKLAFLLKKQHPDYNLLMQVLSEILNLSTGNYVFVLSLVALRIVKLHLKLSKKFISSERYHGYKQPGRLLLQISSKIASGNT